MLVPLGPVAVFGASNFPLAFSVAGGDTISALRRRVPGRRQGASRASGHLRPRAAAPSGRRRARRECPRASSVWCTARSPEVGITLVTHPAIRAVGFTGSLAAGRTLFDAAALRPEPIPVYAEMGSSNPVFILPGAIAERASAIARGARGLGDARVRTVLHEPGPACSSSTRRPSSAFLEETGGLLAATPPGTMVHGGIKAGIRPRASAKSRDMAGVTIGGPRGRARARIRRPRRAAALLLTDARAWSRQSAARRRDLRAGDARGALRVAAGDAPARARPSRPPDRHDPRDRQGPRRLRRARARSSGAASAVSSSTVFPTGVEVCHAMQHGGPYPGDDRLARRRRSARRRSSASRGRSATRTFRRAPCPRSCRLEPAGHLEARGRRPDAGPL